MSEKPTKTKKKSRPPTVEEIQDSYDDIRILLKATLVRADRRKMAAIRALLKSVHGVIDE